MKFKELGLNDQILESLHYMNFEEATPIQEKAMEQTDYILFAVENSDQLEKIQTFPLVQIAETFNSTIRFVHVLTSREEPMEQIDIPESFSDVSTEYIEMAGENVVKTIDTYADDNDINFTCLVYKKRGWLESVFYGTSINTKQFADEDMNVLILKEIG